MGHDVRFALRALKRSPGFTAVAVLSLALGIGASTAVLSLLYQVAMRALPVRDPGALVQLEGDPYNFGWTRRDSNATAYSYPTYTALRDRNPVFSSLVARSSFAVTLTARGEATRIRAELVSGNFFDALGIPPAVGRMIAPADDTAGQGGVVVLGHAYWSEHFAADPLVLNQHMLLNGHPVTVIGVAPRGFRGVVSGRDPEVYAPIAMVSTVVPGWSPLDQPDQHWLALLGRRKPGIERVSTEAALQPLYRAILEDELPRYHDLTSEGRKRILAKTITVKPGSQGVNVLRDQWETPLVVLGVMVLLLLLIACANIANLLIARATARARETAVRLAVGASAWQLARQLLVEGAVLSIAGGLAGLVLAQALTAGLLRLLPPNAVEGWISATVSAPLLLGSLGLTTFAGLLFSAVPVLQAARPDLAGVIKAQAGGMSAAGSHARARQALVAAQVTLSVLLLVGAGLFSRSLVNLMRSDPGFRPERLVTFSVDPSLSGYGQASRYAFFRNLEDRLRGLPGVRGVTRAMAAPFSGWGWGTGVLAPGTKNGGKQYVDCGENSLGPGYFSVLGVPLVAGREFNDRDTASSPKVAILNQSFARYLYEDANPIGRHIQNGAHDTDAEIVGVVADSRYNDVKEKPPRFLYVPYEQGGDDFTRQSTFFLRAQGSEAAIMATVRQLVKQVDPNVPIEGLATMEARISDSIYTERMIAVLATAFGLLATVLAAVGLYGVVAYSVTRRTREFGIRLVLGAVPGSVLRMVVREILWLVAIGAAAGLPLSYALARFAESQLYGVHAYDAGVLAGSAALIAAIAVAAGIAPAIRAMRIEPIQALRHE
jgi:predicted permease